MFHHWRSRTLGPDDGAHRLDVGHEQKDACHDVKNEVAPDGIAAQSENAEHHDEGGNEDHRLQNAHEQRLKAAGMALSDLPDRGMKNQLCQGKRTSRHRIPAFDLEH